LAACGARVFTPVAPECFGASAVAGFATLFLASRFAKRLLPFDVLRVALSSGALLLASLPIALLLLSGLARLRVSPTLVLPPGASLGAPSPTLFRSGFVATLLSRLFLTLLPARGRALLAAALALLRLPALRRASRGSIRFGLPAAIFLASRALPICLRLRPTSGGPRLQQSVQARLGKKLDEPFALLFLFSALAAGIE
jgi:hypothetical protein